MDTITPTPVSIERVVEAMKHYDVALFHSGEHGVATANLNGFAVTFAVFDSVIIVRADSYTNIPSDSGIPTLHLAANQANCARTDFTAAVVDRAEKLIVRTEVNIPSAAGLTDEQLRAQLQAAVDSVLSGQEVIGKYAEVIMDQMEDAQ